MRNDLRDERTSTATAPLTKHARVRMSQRRLSDEAIATVMNYGRLVHTRGAEICAIGRKEVEHFRALGLDLSPYLGVQVVCSSDGAVITAYRSKDLRGLRPRGGRRHHSRQSVQ